MKYQVQVYRTKESLLGATNLVEGWVEVLRGTFYLLNDACRKADEDRSDGRRYRVVAIMGAWYPPNRPDTWTRGDI